MLKRVLEKGGHRVWVAATLGTAAKTIMSNRLDLLVMDLNLADAQGEEAIRAIRKHLKLEIPIIVLTGEITTDTVFALQPLGVSGFVAKSENFGVKLIEEIRRALQS